MKLPSFLMKAVSTEGDNCTIRLSAKMMKILAIVLAVIVILAIALGIWGITRQVELIQLRQQTQLQTEQLRLLNQKTQILEKKMQTLDNLDQEIRQMVKGAEGGKEPQGGPDNDQVSTSSSANKDDAHPVGTDTSKSDEKVDDSEVMTPVEMSARLSKLDVKAQRRLTSFYTLRNVLRDGASSEIQSLQSTIFATGNANATNSTVPSIWPAKGVITSPFGSRTDPVYGGGAFHEGVDIANDYATPIQATAAGVVTFAGYSDGGYGNLVEIDHGNGFVTRYGHNSVILVSVGTHVNQGETISLMGSTGKSTGSHVHYEVRISGSPVDPMLFLPIQ